MIVIQNEPGNINKIIPVFEVCCSSLLKLYQSLCGHFSDEKKKNKLQGYRIMRFKDVGRFASSGCYDLLQQIGRNVQLNGITLLDCSSRSPCSIHPRLSALKIVLPKLLEVDISNIDVDEMSLRVFLIRCPLLEKLTSNNIEKINLSGYWLKPSNNLKVIHMDNTFFSTGEKDKMSGLSNHQEMFIFHHCCKSLERVSIRNAKYRFQSDFFSQNVLIKFVRNSPTSMRWFRSDLTFDNMDMLQIERPEIELLN